MKKNRSHWTVIATVCILLFLLPALVMAGGKKEAAAEDAQFRVALLLDGNIADGGWNGLPYEGLMKAVEDFDIEGSYTEQIPKEDILAVMLDYADRGYDLIIANGYTFGDAMQSVSKDFPDTMFIGLNMPKAGPNLMTSRIVYGVNGHLAGMLAGNMTETKRVGFIAAVDSPQMQVEMGNMRAVLEKIDPQIVLRGVYTGSWSDISLAREGAVSLANDGVDVILNNIDGATGAVAAMAQERGLKVIGWSGDEVHLNPDVILSSLLIRNDIVAYSAIKAALEGNYRPGESLQFGIETGALGYGEFGNAVSSELEEECLKEQKAIETGAKSVPTAVPGWD
jgi:basic membrane protein A and related proteins